jgi:hypothetical protein
MLSTTSRAENVEMSKKKKSDGTPPPTVAVKMDRLLAGRARIIASEMGLDTAQYLSDIVRPQINRDWAKVVKKMDGPEKGTD